MELEGADIENLLDAEFGADFGRHIFAQCFVDIELRTTLALVEDIDIAAFLGNGSHGVTDLGDDGLHLGLLQFLESLGVLFLSLLEALLQVHDFLFLALADILIGFLIVAVVTVAFMAIGHYSYLWSYLPHGGLSYSVDLLVSQATSAFNAFPFGVYFFLVFVILIFFWIIL